jgi:hypothetical protein
MSSVDVSESRCHNGALDQRQQITLDALSTWALASSRRVILVFLKKIFAYVARCNFVNFVDEHYPVFFDLHG